MLCPVLWCSRPGFVSIMRRARQRCCGPAEQGARRNALLALSACSRGRACYPLPTRGLSWNARLLSKRLLDATWGTGGGTKALGDQRFARRYRRRLI
jgi:hypothetical protein